MERASHWNARQIISVDGNRHLALGYVNSWSFADNFNHFRSNTELQLDINIGQAAHFQGDAFALYNTEAPRGEGNSVDTRWKPGNTVEARSVGFRLSLTHHSFTGDFHINACHWRAALVLHITLNSCVSFLRKRRREHAEFYHADQKNSQ